MTEQTPTPQQQLANLETYLSSLYNKLNEAKSDREAAHIEWQIKTCETRITNLRARI